MQRLAFVFVLLLITIIPSSIPALINDFTDHDDSAKGCKTPFDNPCDNNSRHTRTDLTPTVRFVLNPRRISADSAFALIGEVGYNNYRINGTVGMAIDPNNRFKLSAEYLTQRLNYTFTSGNAKSWIHQFAFGGAYEYFLNYCWLGSVEVSSFYSHAISRKLSTVGCRGNSISVFRRIAGGCDFGFTVGGNVFPWDGSKFSYNLTYDRVDYRRKFSSSFVVSGVGASFAYYQKLFYNLETDLEFEFRRPFNYYYGALKWSPNFRWIRKYGDLKFGIFGSRTAGKSSLPSSSYFGFELDFSFGAWGVNSYNCMTETDDYCSESCVCQGMDLGEWVNWPAVYMPQVLAISEERIVNNCTAAPFSIPVPNQVITALGAFSIAMDAFFVDPTGIVPLTFTATGLPSGVTINPRTGEITGVNLLDSNAYPITVTAANPCGSTSQSFTITFSCAGVPPVSSTIPTQIVDANGPYLLEIGSFFSDPTGKNPLTFSAVGLIVGSSINSVTGEITGINPADNTTHTVIVTATNNCGSTNQEFDITYTCMPPISQPIPDQSFGGAPNYMFNTGTFFTDVTGSHPLTFSAVGLPPGSSINAATGLITGTNPQDGSVANITVTASNICGSTSQSFSITFLCTPPTSTPIPTQNVAGAPGDPYSFNVSANFTDPTGVNAFTFEATGLPAGSSINSITGEISGVVPETVPASFQVTVTATNTCGSQSQMFTLNFTGAPMNRKKTFMNW